MIAAFDRYWPGKEHERGKTTGWKAPVERTACRHVLWKEGHHQLGRSQVHDLQQNSIPQSTSSKFWKIPTFTHLVHHYHSRIHHIASTTNRAFLEQAFDIIFGLCLFSPTITMKSWILTGAFAGAASAYGSGILPPCGVGPTNFLPSTHLRCNG